MTLARRSGRFIPLALVTVLAACASINPISHANTVEQKALAAYGSLTIGVQQIAALTKPGVLSNASQARLVPIGETAGRLAKSGLAAYNAAQSARAAFVVDASLQGIFAASVASLDNWVTEAEPVVANLKAAIQGAK